MDAELINPFVRSALSVFRTMLDCAIQREGLSLRTGSTPAFDVTAVIGLSGVIRGSVVLSVPRAVAFKVVERLVGIETVEIDQIVVDAVGEMANMIAGGAKAELAAYRLSLGLPSVVVGKDHQIFFPENVSPLCISFRTAWGPTSLEVALDTHGAETAGPRTQALQSAGTPASPA